MKSIQQSTNEAMQWQTEQCSKNHSITHVANIIANHLWGSVSVDNLTTKDFEREKQWMLTHGNVEHRLNDGDFEKAWRMVPEIMFLIDEAAAAY